LTITWLQLNQALKIEPPDWLSKKKIFFGFFEFFFFVQKREKKNIHDFRKSRGLGGKSSGGKSTFTLARTFTTFIIFSLLRFRISEGAASSDYFLF